jgi:1-acyl-sn-glycerol-3-phosphate acyltransferase
VGSIPVERGEQAASVQALKTLLDLLEGGNGVGIYPEGTRSRDGLLYRGRTGVGWLALTTGAPVVPVGLIGTDALQPAGSKGIRPAALHHAGRRPAVLREDRAGHPAAGPPQRDRHHHGLHRATQRPAAGRRLQQERPAE